MTLSCQLIHPEPVEPEDTLAQRIRSRGDVKTFAKKLTATQKVSTLCTDDPLEDHIHILVKPKSKSVRSPVNRPSLTKALFTSFVSLSLYYSHASSSLHHCFPLPLFKSSSFLAISLCCLLSWLVMIGVLSNLWTNCRNIPLPLSLPLALSFHLSILPDYRSSMIGSSFKFRSSIPNLDLYCSGYDDPCWFFSRKRWRSPAEEGEYRWLIVPYEQNWWYCWTSHFACASCLIVVAPILSCYPHLPFCLSFHVRQLVVPFNFLDTSPILFFLEFRHRCVWCRPYRLLHA